jgi:endoglucanase
MKKVLILFCLGLLLTCMVGTTYAGISLSDQGFKLGAWLGGQASSGGINNFQSLIGRNLDTIMVYMDWATEFSAVQSTIFDAIYNNGSTAILTWEAWDMSNSDVANGSRDAYITRTANAMRNYGREIWIALFHEGNGNWYPWAIGDSSVNTNSTYIAAYRRVVDLFRNAGATNVKWIYNINCTNNGTNASYLGQYPGDSYVDYLAIDGYNWGTTQSWGSVWQSFEQIFQTPYNTLSGINKPIVIDEIASTEIGGNKATWISNTFNSIRSSFPRIKAVSWFNANKETDWRVNSSQAALDAFKAALLVNATAPPTATPTPTTAFNRGDVNNNGTIDIVDALMTAQYYVGLNPPGFVYANADVNRDGQITIVDALMIAQYYVGLIPGF